MVKISPEWVTGPEQGRVSPVVGLLPTPQLAEGIMVDLRRDFWNGSQVAQLQERYMMVMMMMIMKIRRVGTELFQAD